MKTAGGSEMGEDFFQYLPSDIIVNIVSRLPTYAAMLCKCVCKSWSVLLATPEFVNSHISRSVLCIAVETHSKSYDVMEIVDELADFDDEYNWCADFNFELPFDEPIHSSVNGLIFLRGAGHGDLILCNPVTRDYIKLPRQTTSKDQFALESFGFGVSRTTGQYKVVWVFEGKPRCQLECQVYTIGTGTWRKVSYGSSHRLFDRRGGLLFNGKLHWRVLEKIAGDWVERISCLDLETELFSTFSAPYPCDIMPFLKTLCVLRDCLCLCHTTDDQELAIWSMKEYGDEKSWTKEVLTGNSLRGHVVYHVCPIKVFENGDILLECDRDKLFYYSNKTKIHYEFFIQEDSDVYISTTMYSPSFLTLKNFATENLSSF